MALSGVLSHLAEALSAGGGDTRKRMSDALRRLDPKSCGGTTPGTDKEGVTPRELDLKALLPQREVEKEKEDDSCCWMFLRREDLQSSSRAGLISSLA